MLLIASGKRGEEKGEWNFELYLATRRKTLHRRIAQRASPEEERRRSTNKEAGKGPDIPVLPRERGDSWPLKFFNLGKKEGSSFAERRKNGDLR